MLKAEKEEDRGNAVEAFARLGAHAGPHMGLLVQAMERETESCQLEQVPAAAHSAPLDPPTPPAPLAPPTV